MYVYDYKRLFMFLLVRFYDRISLYDLYVLVIRNLLFCRFYDVFVGVFKSSYFFYYNYLKNFYNCVLGVCGNDILLGKKCIFMFK